MYYGLTETSFAAILAFTKAGYRDARLFMRLACNATAEAVKISKKQRPSQLILSVSQLERLKHDDTAFSTLIDDLAISLDDLEKLEVSALDVHPPANTALYLPDQSISQQTLFTTPVWLEDLAGGYYGPSIRFGDLISAWCAEGLPLHELTGIVSIIDLERGQALMNESHIIAGIGLKGSDAITQDGEPCSKVELIALDDWFSLAQFGAVIAAEPSIESSEQLTQALVNQDYSSYAGQGAHLFVADVTVGENTRIRREFSGAAYQDDSANAPFTQPKDCQEHLEEIPAGTSITIIGKIHNDAVSAFGGQLDTAIHIHGISPIVRAFISGINREKLYSDATCFSEINANLVHLSSSQKVHCGHLKTETDACHFQSVEKIRVIQALPNVIEVSKIGIPAHDLVNSCPIKPHHSVQELSVFNKLEIGPSEAYVNECFDALCSILDNFDKTNSAHLEIVTRYLYLLRPGSLALSEGQFCMNARPHYIETYIASGDPDAPHFKNVSFELIVDGDSWKLDYHILVDFGQPLPKTLQVFEKKWGEAYARFGVMLTSTNVLIALLDAIVDVPQSTLTANPGASSGVLYHVVEFCRQWGLHVGAEQFFLKNAVSGLYANGMDGQKINKALTQFFKPSLRGPAMFQGEPDDPRLEKFREFQEWGNETYPTVEVFLFAPIPEQLKQVLLESSDSPDLEGGLLSHASALPTLSQLNPEKPVLLKNGVMVSQSLIAITMDLLEKIQQFDADFIHQLWSLAQDSHHALVIHEVPEYIINKEAVLQLINLLSKDDAVRKAVRNIILSAVSGNDKNVFLTQLDDPRLDGNDLVESELILPKSINRTMHEAVGLDDEVFEMRLEDLAESIPAPGEWRIDYENACIFVGEGVLETQGGIDSLQASAEAKVRWYVKEYRLLLASIEMIKIEENRLYYKEVFFDGKRWADGQVHITYASTEKRRLQALTEMQKGNKVLARYYQQRAERTCLLWLPNTKDPLYRQKMEKALSEYGPPPEKLTTVLLEGTPGKKDRTHLAYNLLQLFDTPERALTAGVILNGLNLPNEIKEIQKLIRDGILIRIGHGYEAVYQLDSWTYQRLHHQILRGEHWTYNQVEQCIELQEGFLRRLFQLNLSADEAIREVEKAIRYAIKTEQLILAGLEKVSVEDHKIYVREVYFDGKALWKGVRAPNKYPEHWIRAQATIEEVKGNWPLGRFYRQLLAGECLDWLPDTADIAYRQKMEAAVECYGVKIQWHKKDDKDAAKKKTAENERAVVKEPRLIDNSHKAQSLKDEEGELIQEEKAVSARDFSYQERKDRIRGFSQLSDLRSDFFPSEETARSLPMSRGLSAGSRNLSTSLDPADKPRDVGVETRDVKLPTKKDKPPKSIAESTGLQKDKFSLGLTELEQMPIEALIEHNRVPQRNNANIVSDVYLDLIFDDQKALLKEKNSTIEIDGYFVPKACATADGCLKNQSLLKAWNTKKSRKFYDKQTAQLDQRRDEYETFCSQLEKSAWEEFKTITCDFSKDKIDLFKQIFLQVMRYRETVETALYAHELNYLHCGEQASCALIHELIAVQKDTQSQANVQKIHLIHLYSHKDDHAFIVSGSTTLQEMISNKAEEIADLLSKMDGTIIDYWNNPQAGGVRMSAESAREQFVMYGSQASRILDRVKVEEYATEDMHLQIQHMDLPDDFKQFLLKYSGPALSEIELKINQLNAARTEDLNIETDSIHSSKPTTSHQIKNPIESSRIKTLLAKLLVITKILGFSEGQAEPNLVHEASRLGLGPTADFAGPRPSLRISDVTDVTDIKVVDHKTTQQEELPCEEDLTKKITEYVLSEPRKMRLLWKNDDQRDLEWNLAREHLIYDGCLVEDGAWCTSLSDERITNEFIVLDRKILCLSPQRFNPSPITLKGGYVRYAEDEHGFAYIIKSMPFYQGITEHHVAKDLNIAGNAFINNQLHGDNLIRIPYHYLGQKLLRYLIENKDNLTESQRLNLAIKTALAVHELHTGVRSSQGIAYVHRDLQSANIVIDDNLEVHLIDLTSASILEEGEAVAEGNLLDERSRGKDIISLLILLNSAEFLGTAMFDHYPKLKQFFCNVYDLAFETKTVTATAFDIARQLTIARCQLASEYHQYLSSVKNIQVINALYTDGIALDPKYFSPEMVSAIQILSTAGIKITPFHLTAEGCQVIHELQSIAHDITHFVNRSLVSIDNLDNEVTEKDLIRNLINSVNEIDVESPWHSLLALFFRRRKDKNAEAAVPKEQAESIRMDIFKEQWKAYLGSLSVKGEPLRCFISYDQSDLDVAMRIKPFIDDLKACSLLQVLELKPGDRVTHALDLIEQSDCVLSFRTRTTHQSLEDSWLINEDGYPKKPTTLIPMEKDIVKPDVFKYAPEGIVKPKNKTISEAVGLDDDVFEMSLADLTDVSEKQNEMFEKLKNAVPQSSQVEDTNDTNKVENEKTAAVSKESSLIKPTPPTFIPPAPLYMPPAKAFIPPAPLVMPDAPGFIPPAAPVIHSSHNESESVKPKDVKQKIIKAQSAGIESDQFVVKLDDLRDEVFSVQQHEQFNIIDSSYKMRSLHALITQHGEIIPRKVINDWFSGFKPHQRQHLIKHLFTDMGDGRQYKIRRQYQAIQERAIITTPEVIVNRALQSVQILHFNGSMQELALLIQRILGPFFKRQGVLSDFIVMRQEGACLFYDINFFPVMIKEDLRHRPKVYRINFPGIRQVSPGYYLTQAKTVEVGGKWETGALLRQLHHDYNENGPQETPIQIQQTIIKKCLYEYDFKQDWFYVSYGDGKACSSKYFRHFDELLQKPIDPTLSKHDIHPDTFSNDYLRIIDMNPEQQRAEFKLGNVTQVNSIQTVTPNSVPTSRGLSAGSSDVQRLLDPADKPRDVDVVDGSQQIPQVNSSRPTAIEIEIAYQTGLTLEEFVAYVQRHEGQDGQLSKLSGYKLAQDFGSMSWECVRSNPQYWVKHMGILKPITFASGTATRYGLGDRLLAELEFKKATPQQKAELIRSQKITPVLVSPEMHQPPKSRNIFDDQLIDILMQHNNRITMTDLHNEFGWTVSYIYSAVRSGKLTQPQGLGLDYDFVLGPKLEALIANRNTTQEKSKFKSKSQSESKSKNKTVSEAVGLDDDAFEKSLDDLTEDAIAKEESLVSPTETLSEKLADASFTTTTTNHEAIKKSVDVQIFIGGSATQAVVLTLLKQGVIAEKMVIISAPSWLEKMDPSWNDRPWFQSMRYLPPATKEIAMRLFPDYPASDNMNCGMMQQIVMEQRRSLRAAGVLMIEEKVDSITHTELGVVYSSGGKEHVLVNTPHVHFFNAARRANSQEFIDVHSMGEVYAQSKLDSIDKILAVVGSGLNLDNVLDDFPSARIVHLIPSGDRLRPDLAKRLYASFRIDDLYISYINCNTDKGMIILDSVNLIDGAEMHIKLPVNQVYSATGEKVDLNLIKADASRVSIIDASAKPDAIDRFYSFWSTTLAPTLKTKDGRGSKIPDGSLSHCYYKILSTVFNKMGQPEVYPLDNVYAMMFMEGWKPAMEQKAISVGITINPEFYDLLFTRLKHCFTDTILHEQQIWRVIQSTFEQGLSDPSGQRVPVAMQAGAAVEWKLFATLLNSESHYSSTTHVIPSIATGDAALDTNVGVQEPSKEPSTHTAPLQQLSLKLEEQFTIPPSTRIHIKGLKVHLMSNEAGYWEALQGIDYIRPHPQNKHIKVALLFGESNFLSLLPTLSNLADIILMADIESELHKHNLHMLNTFIQSKSPNEFLRRYLIDNPSPHLNDSVLRVFGKMSAPYYSLKEYHFLYDQVRFDECKQAAEKLLITQIHFDLLDGHSCADLNQFLKAHDAQLTLCNFTNIHHYADPSEIYSATSMLLEDSEPCVVMYAQGPKSNLSTTFSIGLTDYYADCLHMLAEDVEHGHSNISNSNTNLCFVQKAQQPRSARSYVALFGQEFEQTTIENIINGRCNINDCSKQLHAFETIDEATAFAEQAAERSLLGKLVKSSNWVFTLNVDHDEANAHLQYRGDRSQWIHSSRFQDKFGLYFSQNIISSSNMAGTIILEKSSDNSFEVKARGYFTEAVINEETVDAKITGPESSRTHQPVVKKPSVFKRAIHIPLAVIASLLGELQMPTTAAEIEPEPLALGDAQVESDLKSNQFLKKASLQENVKKIVNLKKIVHIRQTHRTVKEPSFEILEVVSRSQYLVAREILKHPGSPVVEEGLDHDIYTVNEQLQKVKTLFPHGLPTQFSTLTPPQKLALYTHGGVGIVFALGHIPAIYQDSHYVSADQFRAFLDKVRYELSTLDAIQSPVVYINTLNASAILNNPKLDHFLSLNREVEAIRYAKEAVVKYAKDYQQNNPSVRDSLAEQTWLTNIKQQVRQFYELTIALFGASTSAIPPAHTVILVYGANHDFAKLCAKSGIELEEVNTSLQSKRPKKVSFTDKTPEVTVHFHEKVELKTGQWEGKSLIQKTMAVLKQLQAQEPSAFHETVMKARDSGYQFPVTTDDWKIKYSALVKSDGTMPQEIRNIILAAVSGEGKPSQLRLQDPVKPFAVPRRLGLGPTNQYGASPVLPFSAHSAVPASSVASTASNAAAGSRPHLPVKSNIHTSANTTSATIGTDVAKPVEVVIDLDKNLPANLADRVQGNYDNINCTREELLEWQRAEHQKIAREAVEIAERVARNEYLLESNRVKDLRELQARIDHAHEYRLRGHRDVTHYFDARFTHNMVWEGEINQPLELPPIFEPSHPMSKWNVILKRIGIGQSPFLMGLLPGVLGNATGQFAAWVAQTYDRSENEVDAIQAGVATAASGLFAAAFNINPFGRVVYMATVGTAHVADILAKHEQRDLAEVPDTASVHMQTRAATGLGQMLNDLFGFPVDVFLGVAKDLGHQTLFDQDDQSSTPTDHTFTHTEASVNRFVAAADKAFTAIGQYVLTQGGTSYDVLAHCDDSARPPASMQSGQSEPGSWKKLVSMIKQMEDPSTKKQEAKVFREQQAPEVLQAAEERREAARPTVLSAKPLDQQLNEKMGAEQEDKLKFPVHTTIKAPTVSDARQQFIQQVNSTTVGQSVLGDAADILRNLELKEDEDVEFAKNSKKPSNEYTPAQQVTGMTPKFNTATAAGTKISVPSRFSASASTEPSPLSSAKLPKYVKPTKPRVNRTVADSETDKLNRSHFKATNSGNPNRSSTMPPRTQKSKTAHSPSSNVGDRRTAGLTSDTIHQYRQFAEAIRNLESNSTAATRVYDMERLVEHYSQYMRKNVAYYRGFEYQSSITDLASSFYVSPSTFHHNATLIGDITFKFLNESHPEAKAFVEKTLLHLQLDYLDEIKTLSEVSVVDTTDTINTLMDAAKIPSHARPFFHQQCLSMLASAQLTSQTDELSSGTVRTDLKVLQQLHAQKNAEYSKLPQQPLSEAEETQHFKALEQSNKKISSIAHEKEPPKGLTPAEREEWVALKKQTDEISEILKKQQSEQETQKTVAGYKAAAQFVSMLGDVTQEPIIHDVGTLCMAGVLAYEASVGFSALTAASSFGACLGPIAMAGMAALMVFGLFCKQKRNPQSDEAHKQIMQALAQIMSKLDAMHKEMHQRFDRLEGIELETRRQMLLGFDAVLAELHTVVDFELLQFHALEKIDAKVSAVLDEMHAGFEGVQDTLIQPTIENILSPTQKQFLEHLDEGRYATYMAQLTHFLMATSCLPAYNGSDQVLHRNGKCILDHNAIANILSGQSGLAAPAKKQLNGLLGLLAMLANEHSGAESYVSQPQSLPNPAQWELGLLAYEKLVRGANLRLQRDKEAHLGTIHTLTKKAEKIKTFIHHVAQDKTLSTNLIKKSVENYHNHLNDIEKLIQHHLETQEKEFYKKFCIQVRSGERLLKLDESFDEARKRQTKTQFLEQCENSPASFSAEIKQPESRYSHVTVSPYIFHQGLERPNSTMFNSIHEGRHKVGDAGKLGWENFKAHCTTLVNPTVTADKSLSIWAPHIALAVKLQRVNITKKYHVEMEEVCDSSIICREFPIETDEHHNEEFTRRVSNRFSFQLSSVDDKKQIMLLSGSKARAVRSYWPFTIREDDGQVGQEALALYLGTFWIASGAPIWGDTTIASINLSEFESFFKTIANELHDVIKPYRIAAIQQLRLNVEFQVALEKLESSALQLHAFSNLLDINWGSVAKPLRAEWINAQLTNIAQANSNNAIVLLQGLLKKMLDKDALKANDLLSAIPRDIKKNPLYDWAEKSIYALENLAKTVVAWPDMTAEREDATLLAAKLDATEKKIDQLTKKLDTFTFTHHSPEEQLDEGTKLLTASREQIEHAKEALQLVIKKSRILVQSGQLSDDIYNDLSERIKALQEETEQQDTALIDEDENITRAIKIVDGSFSEHGLFPYLLRLNANPDEQEEIVRDISRYLASQDEGVRASIVNEQETDSGKTPMHFVAAADNTTLVKCLLSADARIDIKDHAEHVCWEDAPRKTRALIRSRGEWQQQTANLGFSFNRTLWLIEQASQVVETIDSIDVPGVLFMGPTGAGKSTLINAALGVEYEASKGEYGEPIVIPSATSKREAARTSSAAMSETLFPGVFLTEDKKIALVDMPGFGETRGDPEIICGGVVTQLMYQQFKTLKGITMVCPLDDLKPRFEHLRTLLENVGTLFQGLSDEVMRKHLFLVMSKTGGADTSHVVKNLKTWMKSEYQDVTDASPPKRWAVKRILSILTSEPQAVMVVDVTNQASIVAFHQKIQAMQAFESVLLHASDSHQAVSLFKTLLKNIREARERLITEGQNLESALATKLIEVLPREESIALPEALMELHTSLASSESSTDTDLNAQIDEFIEQVDACMEESRVMTDLVVQSRTALKEGVTETVVTGTLETIHEDTLERLAALEVNQDFFATIDTITERLGLGEVTHAFSTREPKPPAYAVSGHRFFDPPRGAPTGVPVDSADKLLATEGADVELGEKSNVGIE